MGIWFHDARIVGLHLQHFGTGVFEVETGQNMRVFHRDQLIDHEQKFFSLLSFCVVLKMVASKKQPPTKSISIDVAVKAVFEWMISCQQELQTNMLGDAKHWGASFAS